VIAPEALSVMSVTGTPLTPGGDGAPFSRRGDLTRLTAPIDPGERSLFLSVFDQGDRTIDSAAYLDRLFLGVDGPDGECIEDVEPPETTIDEGPSGTVGVGHASFAFSSSEPFSTFGCSIDSGPFEPCSSPKEVDGLDEGEHLFRVRATDAFGNTDPTPAERTWVVDTSAQIDAMIRAGSEPGFVGEGVYGSDGVGQERTVKVRPGRIVWFTVRVRNDAQAADDAIVRAPGSRRGCRVRWFDGETDVTGAVTGPGYRVDGLGAGDVHDLAARVTATKRAKSRAGWRIDASSARVPGSGDVVIARVERRRR
jgi:hypothetical protein